MSPDILLGPGDTAPITEKPLYDRDGNPLDLTGCTVVFWYQPRNGSVAKASRAVTIVAPATDGVTRIDWLATGGAIPQGNYNARYKVTYLDGHVLSIPDGIRTAQNGGDVIDESQEFLWLRVAVDFAAVP